MEWFPILIQSSIFVINLLGILCNFFLIPVIIIKSSHSMGSYKYLLLSYSCIAMINSFASLLTIPSTSSGWVLYSTVQRIPRDQGSIVICLFSATYINLVIILSYSFIYRYFAIRRNCGLQWFEERKKVVFLIIVFFTLFLLCAIPLFLYTYQNEKVENSIKIVSQGVYNLKLKELAFIGVPIFEDGFLIMKSISLMILWCVVMMSAFSVSAFCSYKIVQLFHNMNIELSQKTKTEQYKLFLLLIYQTTIPLVFEFLPIIASYVMAFLELSYPFFSAICSIFLSIAKFIDPLLILLIVSEYRRSILVFFKCSFSQQAISMSQSPRRLCFHTLFGLRITDHKAGGKPADGRTDVSSSALSVSVSVSNYPFHWKGMVEDETTHHASFCCKRFNIIHGAYMVAISYCVFIIANIGLHCYTLEVEWNWQLFFFSCDTVSVACLFFGLIRRRPAFLQPFTVVSITTVNLCILLTMYNAMAVLRPTSYYGEQIEIQIGGYALTFSEFLHITPELVRRIYAISSTIAYATAVFIHSWFMVIVVHCAQWLREKKDKTTLADSLMLEERENSTTILADESIEKGSSYL